MKSPILFIDIDGVLLSGRAWLLPVNRRLQAAGAKLTGQEASKLIGREAQFDACAVVLVTRICEVTGARIVVASSWRYTVGYEQTRLKLLEQGLPEAMFHEDWACPMARFSTLTMRSDIEYWLEEHGDTRPDSWLVLDDEDIAPGVTMRTDALDGLVPERRPRLSGTWKALIRGSGFVRLPKATRPWCFKPSAATALLPAGGWRV